MPLACLWKLLECQSYKKCVKPSTEGPPPHFNDWAWPTEPLAHQGACNDSTGGNPLGLPCPLLGRAGSLEGCQHLPVSGLKVNTAEGGVDGEVMIYQQNQLSSC